MLPRRSFFKVGVAGAFFLAGAYSLTRSLDFEKHPDFDFFDREDVEILSALSSAILFGTKIDVSRIEEIVRGVEITVLGLTPMVQKEIRELLLLFKWRPLRWSTGRNSSWSGASRSEIETLLISWRTHRLSIFRGAYSALCELVNASYYARSENWQDIGYPGPPELEL